MAFGYIERDEMIRFRDMVVPISRSLGLNVITDKDAETLPEYLDRIKTGTGSVVLEFHLNAAPDSSASGSLVLVGDDADRLDMLFAKELVDTTSKILGVQNRGVMMESQSHRKRLGLMREQGIVALLEICFITNESDMNKFRSNQPLLSISLSGIIRKYENMLL